MILRTTAAEVVVGDILLDKNGINRRLVWKTETAFGWTTIFGVDNQVIHNSPSHRTVYTFVV